MSRPPQSKPSLLVALLFVIGVAVAAVGMQVTSHRARMARINPQAASSGKSSRESEARSIPQIIAETDRAQDPMQLTFLNRERAKAMREQIAQGARTMPPDALMNLRVSLVNELVSAGMTEEAARECRELARQLKTYAPDMWSQVGGDLLTLQAISNLRTGEEQNCCSVNNPDSCLLPVSGRGIHKRPYGSREAIKCLADALRAQPDSVAARWLLNIAYMTLGEYPNKVPPKWLIPMAAFGGNGPLQRFHNAAPEMGLDFLGWAGGAALEDYDGDGLLDLMISGMRPGNPTRYFRNKGDGSFEERTKGSGLEGETGALNFITTDYNNDGRPDVVLLRGGWYGKSGHYPLSLMRNDGGGKFTDVTIRAGLMSMGPTQTAVAFDYNGDGFLDLFVGYEARAGDPVQSRLFRNEGDGTFTDVTGLCGLNIRRLVKAVVSADYLKTGRPGLYLSCGEQKNVLLRNDGPEGADKSPKAPWKFTDVSYEARVDTQDASFSCFFFDYDNDGWPDIYVNGYGGVRNVGDVAADYLGLPTAAERARLYRNNGNGTFTDVSTQAGLYKVTLGMGMNFGDLDNDGWLDFYVGTGNPDLGTLIPNRMFRNVGGKRFDEVTTSGNFGHLQKGHGIVFADLNNDGQQDIYEVMGGAYGGDTAHSCLYVNPGSKNRWLKLHLTGEKSNRVAIGAEICVTVMTPRGERKIYKTVGPGGSFGCNPLRQEIGLGNATAIKQVDIRWPSSGVQQTLTGLELDHTYRVKEGDSKAVLQSLPRFGLPSGSGMNPRVARRQ